MLMSWLIAAALLGSLMPGSFADIQEVSELDKISPPVTARPEYPPPDLTLVRFLLWTRENPVTDDYYSLLYNKPLNLQNSPFDGSKRTHFLLHGWGGNGYTGYITQIKDLLLQWSDCQVISIDYQDAASPGNYDRAVSNTYYVSEYSGSFIDYLVTETNLMTSQIHITGHSLGGQAAGLTAKNVASGLIDRVTSLDPAGPLYYTQPPERRLDKTDAAFVDVIHTNGCGLQKSCEGQFQALGHADFYPNGGHHQAGCVAPADLLTGCSHARSHDYWLESLKAPFDPDFKDQFWGYQCSDYETYKTGACTDESKRAVMGFRASRSLTGSFFFDTNRKSPFAQG